MYQDMSGRDLLQHRATLSNGDTVWRPSPVVTAALNGHLLILDGMYAVALNEGLYVWGGFRFLVKGERGTHATVSQIEVVGLVSGCSVPTFVSCSLTRLLWLGFCALSETPRLPLELCPHALPLTPLGESLSPNAPHAHAHFSTVFLFVWH